MDRIRFIYLVILAFLFVPFLFGLSVIFLPVFFFGSAADTFIENTISVLSNTAFQWGLIVPLGGGLWAYTQKQHKLALSLILMSWTLFLNGYLLKTSGTVSKCTNEAGEVIDCRQMPKSYWKKRAKELEASKL